MLNISDWPTLAKIRIYRDYQSINYLSGINFTNFKFFRGMGEGKGGVGEKNTSSF
jgi:hypothetical protein